MDCSYQDTEQESENMENEKTEVLKKLEKKVREMKFMKMKIVNKRMNILRDILNFLEAAKRGFHSTILCVSMNNGSNWAESSAAISRSTEKIKQILPLSFPSKNINENCHERNSNAVRNDANNSFKNIGEEKSICLSIAESLGLLSAQEINALGLVAPIIIATDSPISTTTLTSITLKDNPSQKYDSSCLHDNPARSDLYNGRNRPILDVAGIKLSCFKNAISAIKMFLSAPITVTNS